MADLQQALDRLLADPEAMARIMDLAGKLGGPGDAAAQESGGQARPLPEGPPPASDAAPPDPARLGSSAPSAPIFPRTGGENWTGRSGCPPWSGAQRKPRGCGRRGNCLYNAYLSSPGPQESRPADSAPGGGIGSFGFLRGEAGQRLREMLSLSRLDSGDLLLLLVLLLLWKEGDADPILLLALAAAFLLEN